MIPSSSTSLLFIVATLLLGSCITTAIDTKTRPNFTATARVKQHFHKSGNLVEGEEHLIKVILKWDHLPNANAYEICHNCHHINEDTGIIIEDDDEKKSDDANTGGKIYEVDMTGGKNTCGGQPCLVMPNTPRGNNKYHLRLKDMSDLSVSAWSKYQNFMIDEPGTEVHSEL